MADRELPAGMVTLSCGHRALDAVHLGEPVRLAHDQQVT